MENRFLITSIRRVILVGKEEYRERVTVFRSKQIRNELIYHFSGRSTATFNGKRMENEPDTLRFLPAGEVREYAVERKEPGECIDVFFDTDSPVAPEAFVMRLRQNGKIRDLFRRIFSVWVSRREGSYFECLSLLYQIFAELEKNDYLPEKTAALIRPAAEYIEKHFLEGKIRAEDLAALSPVSYPYLKKLFVRRFGVPPIRYAIRLRIRYASDLLQSGQYCVKDAAEICGYRDAYYFSRQFKEVTGLTPTGFLKKYRSSK